jgi:hypothetical protein
MRELEEITSPGLGLQLLQTRISLIIGQQPQPNHLIDPMSHISATLRLRTNLAIPSKVRDIVYRCFH